MYQVFDLFTYCDSRPGSFNGPDDSRRSYLYATASAPTRSHSLHTFRNTRRRLRLDRTERSTVEEMAYLKTMFGLHSLAFEDALNGRQVPKVDIYWRSALRRLAKTAHLEKRQDNLLVRPVSLSANSTSSQSGTDRHDHTRNCANNLSKRASSSRTVPTMFFMESLTSSSMAICHSSKNDRRRVLDIEMHVLIPSSNPEQIRRIFRMRRQVIKFQRVIGPMAESCQQTRPLDFPASTTQCETVLQRRS